MGDLRVVQLTKLAHPLAPGTVAFSVAPSLQCEHANHRRNPWSLLSFTGVTQDDGTVKVERAGKNLAYQRLWNRYLLYKVESHAILELQEDAVLATGDFVAGFSYPCARALPFMFVSPAWLTTAGIKAYRTDLNPFGSKLCFTPDPAGWFLVQADWNIPLSPHDLKPRQAITLYDYQDGQTSPRVFSQLQNGWVKFAGGNGGVGVECVGSTHWLFRRTAIPAVV